MAPLGGRITAGMEGIKRLVRVDQKPIGRTPRSNLATYTGLFDPIRKLFAATEAARARRYDAGRFSFNVAKGRCENCEGEGFVMVELLFLPSVYAPCPVCHGARYNAKTLEIKYRGKSIADVLGMTVDAACEFFADEPQVLRSLDVLREVGLGYIRLGQPATELSGGEAQRIKLATELQRAQRGDTLYVLDEPTTGLHPADVEQAHGPARRPGRIGQHGHRGGARDAGRGGERLGHRRGAGRGGRRRPGRRGRAARRGGEVDGEPDGPLPGPFPGRLYSEWEWAHPGLKPRPLGLARTHLRGRDSYDVRGPRPADWGQATTTFFTGPGVVRANGPVGSPVAFSGAA